MADPYHFGVVVSPDPLGPGYARATVPRSLTRHSEGRFVALFGLTVALHVALPLAGGQEWLNLGLGLTLAGLLGYAGWITLTHQTWRRAHMALILVSLASTAMVIASERVTWMNAFLAFHAGLTALSAALVVRWVARRRQITIDTIFAALTGYYLFAFAWALIYALISRLEPAAFSVPLAADGTLDRAFYFSFVTITTLGYGDIVPAHPLSQALVTIEALIGQVYLVVLVARLVALWGPREPKAEPEAAPSAES